MLKILVTYAVQGEFAEIKWPMQKCIMYVPASAK